MMIVREKHLMLMRPDGLLKRRHGFREDAHVYESPSFVKKERTMGASVNLPFVYPSIGASLAPVGCFEVALAAPSVYEPKAQ